MIKYAMVTSLNNGKYNLPFDAIESYRNGKVFKSDLLLKYCYDDLYECLRCRYFYRHDVILKLEVHGSYFKEIELINPVNLLLKKIYFYEKSPNNFEVLHGYKETRCAILQKQEVIHTTSMCNLSAELLQLGYRIFLISEYGKELEIKIGNTETTVKEIKGIHNFLKLYMGGHFNHDNIGKF